ncbi:MAG: PQQ-binding-like beta-propeller repeat protein [Caldisericia bacterium]|nr:PQQ-binding-like beta-propeller repeat protein [Caldisericia bacterium]
MKEILKRLTIFFICMSMLSCLIGCLNTKNQKQNTNETSLLNDTLPEKMDPDEFNFTSYRTNLSSFPDYFLNLPEVSLETQWILQAEEHQRIRPMKIVQDASNRTILLGISSTFFDNEALTWSKLDDVDYYYQDILAIEMRTGDILWQYRLEEASATSLLEHQGKIYFGTKKGVNELRTFHRVICLDVATGKELWKQRIPGPVQTNLVILNSDQSLCFGVKDLDSFLFVLQPDTGEIVNKIPLSIHFDLYTNWSSLIPVQETTLCFSSYIGIECSTILFFVDIISGEMKPVYHFSTTIHSKCYGNLVQVGSVVCIVTEMTNTDHPHINIHAFDPESKTMVWTEHIPTTLGFAIFTSHQPLHNTPSPCFVNKDELQTFLKTISSWEKYDQICNEFAHRYNVHCKIQHADASHVIVSVSTIATGRRTTPPWFETMWIVIDAQSGEILGKLPIALECYESFEEFYIVVDRWEYGKPYPSFLALGEIQ